MSDDLVAFLRAEIGKDLHRQRGLADSIRATSAETARMLRSPLHVAEEKIARCEAELAILDEHYILWRHDTSEAYEEFSVVSIGGANQDHGCVTCHYYGQGGVKGYGYCRTVRHLGSGYRHRPGYREEEWKP